ncbi:MAG: hypothetical protein SH817_10430 [Leptospira sp.]|nr:hypothetical protein [Leptospira sp.]
MKSQSKILKDKIILPKGRIAMALLNAIAKEGFPYLLKQLDPKLKEEIEKMQLYIEQTTKQENIRKKYFPNAIIVEDYKVIENDSRTED